jgi:streptogramin lyase
MSWMTCGATAVTAMATVAVGMSVATPATQGAVRYFDAPKGTTVNELAPGPNGSAWFVNKSLFERPTRLRIGRITPRGRVTHRATSIVMDRATATSGPNGELWVGWLATRETQRNVTVLHGGLGRASTDAFTDLAPITDGAPLQGAMEDVAIASDGAVWYGTSFGQLGRISQAADPNAQTGRYQNVETMASSSGGLDQLSITPGENATVWFAGSGGLLGSAEPQGDQVSLTLHEVGTKGDLHGVEVTRDGRIWFVEIGFHGGDTRIGRYDPKTGETRFFRTKPFLEPNTSTLVLGPDGNLWFTAGDKKIVRITSSGRQRAFSVGREVSSVTPGLGRTLWLASTPSTSRAKIGRFKIPR